MDVEKALFEIAEMRGHMARSVEFRGYGPQALVLTGVVAALGGGAQAALLPAPAGALSDYLLLWTAVATIALAIIGAEAWRRARAAHAGMANDMLLAAARQFAPSGLAGLLVSLVILRHAPTAAWMLPGLWQIMLSLGVFAASAALPGPMAAVGAWYLATGLACIVYASGQAAFSPLAMALPFLGGQGLAAAILHVAYRGGAHGGADGDE